MLILTRKINQSIIIADNIEVMIIEIKGDQIKLGIKAPSKIPVFRGEIYQEIQKENIEALKTKPSDLESLFKKNKK